MASGIENRVGRIERELGIGSDEDKPIELDFGDGQRVVTTSRELGEILADIQQSGKSRILPKDNTCVGLRTGTDHDDT